MGTRMASVLAGLCSVTVVAAACGGGGGRAGSGGSIAIDGSSTVAPISEAVAEEFRLEHPDVAVSVSTSGTGGGFKRFCAGEIDIADASREIREEEMEACQARGIGYTAFRVALDGLVVATSAQNTFVECLTIDQLATVFKQGGATTWDQVDPTFPKEKIAIFGPGTDSGTYDFFVEEVLGDADDPQSPRPRTDYTASEDDNTLVQGVKGERNSWGYFGFAYFKENRDALKAIALAGEDGRCVEPSDGTVQSGEYPLSRPLFIYVKESSLAKPHVRDFLRFYLEVTPDIVGDVGYTPAPREEYEKGLEVVERAA